MARVSTAGSNQGDDDDDENVSDKESFKDRRPVALKNEQPWTPQEKSSKQARMGPSSTNEAPPRLKTNKQLEVDPFRCSLLSGRHHGSAVATMPDVKDDFIARGKICHECHPHHCEALSKLEQKFVKDLGDRIKKLEHEFNNRVELEAQKKACALLADESSGLMHEQEEKQMQIQRLENRVKALEKQLHDERLDHQAMQSSLREDATVLAYRNADAVAQLDRIRSERKCAETKLKNTADELSKMEIQRDRLSLQVIELTHQRDNMEAQIRTESGTSRRLSCDIDHLRKQLEALHKEKVDVEATVASLEHQKMKADREIFALTEAKAQLEANFNCAQKKCERLQAELDHFTQDRKDAKPRIQEALEIIKKKGEMESKLLTTIDELKGQEHRLKAEIACQAQKLAEKENVSQELWKVKKDLEVMTNRLEACTEEANVLKAENRQAERQKEKAELEVRKLQNEQCLLKQETGVLKKQVATLKQREASITPDTGCITGSRAFRTKALQTSQPPVDLPLRNEDLPSAGQATSCQPETWDLVPPHGIGGGGNKIPSYRRNTESAGFPLPPPGGNKTGSAASNGAAAWEHKAPTGPEVDHLKLLHIQGLEKQLLVLQIEKNQLESDLARFPATTRARTVKSRAQKIELDKRLTDVEASILRVRKELRFNGAIGVSKYQYVS